MRQKKEIEKLQAVIATEESERKRIAEDLHDEIGAALSAIKLQISMYSSIDSKNELDENIKRTSEYLNSVIQNIRRVVRNLSPVTLHNHGLIPGIEDLIHAIERNSHIKINFIFEPISKQWKENAEINIYRIVSEMINNSVKHSNGNEINLTFKVDDRNFTLLYTDNGSNNGSAVSSDGMGIKNIKTRVSLLNGKMIHNDDFSKGASYNISFDNKNILYSTNEAQI